MTKRAILHNRQHRRRRTFTHPRPASHDWTCHRCGLTLQATDIQVLMRVIMHDIHCPVRGMQ